MEILVMAIFTAVIFFYSYRFFHVLVKMKQKIILPTTAKELAVVRKYPQKVVNAPTYSRNKVGIIVYALTLIYVIVMFILGSLFLEFPWTLYLLIMLPMFHLSNLFNLVAVVEDGIICGARFVSWKKIKSYEFVRIDVKHNYYGFSKEVNDQYELKIKTNLGTLNCVVTSEEMKERLNNVIGEQKRTELAVKGNLFNSMDN